jgi:acetate kinase
MGDLILVLNAGSSSLKFNIFTDQGKNPRVLYKGQIEGIFTNAHFVAKNESGKIVAEKRWPQGPPLGHEEAIEGLFAWGREALITADRIAAVGHRIAYGGLEYIQPTIVTPEVLKGLEKYVPMAPLHMPHNIAAVRVIAQRRPEIPQVACFDTSYHTTIPPVAQAYALPRRITDQGVRRYGFHGISYEYIASVLPDFDPDASHGRVAVAHLGSGASICAMQNLKSVACTLGFSALDGLVMGTRCGELDPGVLLYLMDECGMNARDIERLLYKESGLLGVSGISSDMRTLLESSDPRAAEAVDLFVYRFSRELGSIAAALGGLDALVFTGGIGENAAVIRERTCQTAQWLGLELDPDENAKGGTLISRKGSRVRIWVIPTNEELMIATHTRNMIIDM